LSLAGVVTPGLGWDGVVALQRRPEPRRSSMHPRLGTWTAGMSTARAGEPAERADDEQGADALLVERSRTGDTAAFAVLVDRYQQRVFWVARGMLGNDEDARDAAQEAFIRVFRSLEIVVNLCIDMLRKQVKRRGVSLEQVGDVPSGHNGSNNGLESSELKQRVYRVLDELPPKYRTVMVLSDLEGIGAKDIAHMTGTTHATVRWRHHRARQLFREAWERIHGKGSHVV
jgi:RNA polymerase sigma-70 factor, ECF subfamily